MIEKLYTVEEVAELASVTGRTIRNYLKSGRLVGRKIGGQWRFPENEVQRLLTGGTIDPAEDEAPPYVSPEMAPPAPATASAATPESPVPQAPAAEAEMPAAAQSFGAPAQSAPPVAPVFATADTSAAATPDETTPPPEPPAAQRYVPPAPLPEAASPPQATLHQPVQTENTLNIGNSHAASAVIPPPAAMPQAPAAAPQQPGYAPPYAIPEQTPPGPSVSEPQVYPPAYPQQPYAPEMPAPPPPQAPLPESPQQPHLAQPPAAQPAYAQPVQGMPGYPPAADYSAHYQTQQQEFTAAPAYPQPAPAYPNGQPQPAAIPPPALGAPQVTYVVPSASQPPQPLPAYHYNAPAPLPAVYPPSPSSGGYYAPVQPPPQTAMPVPEAPPAEAVSANITPSTPEEQAEPAINVPQATAAAADSGLAHLSDVGKRVAKFVAEVHDCSHGPQICAVFDLHQPLSAARATSERLAAIAAEESDSGQLCQSFVEFDDRYYVARYTLFGTSSFLLRCLKLIG